MCGVCEKVEGEVEGGKAEMKIVRSRSQAGKKRYSVPHVTSFGMFLLFIPFLLFWTGVCLSMCAYED